MRNRFVSTCVVSLLMAACAGNHGGMDLELLPYVNPMIGTAPSTTETARIHSEAGSELRGQTFPAVGMPFGMTHWTPQTRASEEKCISPYYYQDDRIQGFRGSHWWSGSCTQDYGSVTLMALQGDLVTDASRRASRFSHEEEVATPAYYAVALQDYQIQAEMTGTTRAAFLQFTPEKAEDTYLLIEPNSDEGEGFVEIRPEQKEIVGFNPVHRIYQGWGESAGFSGYFVIQFEQAFEQYGIWHGDSIKEEQLRIEAAGNPVGAFIRLASRAGEPLKVRVGTSFTSIHQARKNLVAEISHWDFSQVRQVAEQTWEKEFRKVRVNGGTEEEKEMFYTGLYHTMLLPRIFSDADSAYIGFAGTRKVYKAAHDYYADFSMWDTFRAVHPLYTLMHPEKVDDMISSLLAKAMQGGWLPIFPAWNSYTAAMIGDHVIAMIGDAWMKGIDSFDQEHAYEVMRRNAFEPNTDLKSYRNGKGRRALQSYLKYNFIPLEDSVPDSFHQKEQVSRTLEYAYDDFVLSQVARKLGREQDYQALTERAKNYRHVFDTTTGYVRGRYADGRWIEPFDPVASRASFITEGSPFQYTWFVPHDVEGLISLMGGREKFVQKLDTFFDKRYYWHGNEPGHQTVYLYPYAGAPWKTQQRVRDILQEEYSASPGGLSGNEDAGQMSAWLVFSMMGFYPVSPGIPCYVLGSPVFEQIAMQVEGGQNFVIRASKNSAQNRYIQSAILNGEPLDRSYLWHEEIMQGGELVLQMGPEPNKSWASAPESAPPSMGDL